VLTTDGTTASWSDVRTVLAAGDEAGLVVKGTYTGTAGPPPWTGGGTRMMWYPQRAAFRAGFVSGDEWDDAKVGNYSVAFGVESTASGRFSAAMGNSFATGIGSTALGSSTASGADSTALGNSTASGDISTSMGHGTASGYASTAMGEGTVASGNQSTAMGTLASTNGQQGSIVFGDTSGLTMKSFAPNEFAVQATGGLRFVTGQQPLTLPGLLTSVGTTVTSSIAIFSHALVGATIVAPDNDTRMIVSVESPTSLTVSAPFTTPLAGATFNFIAPSVMIANTGQTSIHTSGSQQQLSLVNDSFGVSWDFYSYTDGNLYLNNLFGTRVTFRENGNVGIGNINTTHTLGVTGTIAASGAISANTTPDLAETIPAAGDVEVADVVCADRRHRERVVRCGARDAGPILGVISDGTSSFLINSHGGREGAPLTGQPLVLAGRVPVKVSTENGPIAIGDWLAPSSQAGVAVRATEPGPVVGIALEAFAGKGGTVLCFVKVGEGGSAERVAQLEQENEQLRERNREIEDRLSRLEGAVQLLGRRCSATCAR
jgi:hypothetical protein